jgi:hypothetical protein
MATRALDPAGRGGVKDANSRSGVGQPYAVLGSRAPGMAGA